MSTQRVHNTSVMSSIIFQGNNVNRIVYNGKEIQRVIYNGTVIWSKTEEPILTLEKFLINLSSLNNYEDTNQVYTNTSFSVS